MGVTAIREIRNNASVKALVRNIETPSDTSGGKGDFEPGDTREVCIWIPWCWAQDQFKRSHMEVVVGSAQFCIWQADRGGQDRVRVSADMAWHDPGDPIDGFSNVNGNRTLIITDTAVSLEDRAPVRNPSSQATSGTASVSFHVLPGKVFNYEGNAAGVDMSVFVERITNTAKDKNGQIKIPMTLSLEDVDGRRAGPTHLAPNETVTGDFRGLRVDGKWKADVEGSATLLPPTFTIELFWNKLSSSGNPLSAAEIVISAVVPNPHGSDVQPQTGEYVELSNKSHQTTDVGGWSVRDERGTRIDLPSGYVIKPAAKLRVYTGPGTNTDNKYYAGRHRAIWNNAGDKVMLYKPTGEFVYQYVYP